MARSESAQNNAKLQITVAGAENNSRCGLQGQQTLASLLPLGNQATFNVALLDCYEVQ